MYEPSPEPESNGHWTMHSCQQIVPFQGIPNPHHVNIPCDLTSTHSDTSNDPSQCHECTEKDIRTSKVGVSKVYHM